MCMRVNVHLKMCAYTFMPRAHMFLHENLLTVHYYVMTLSLKFYKDPSFCRGDICNITLNLHTSGINASASFDTRTCTFSDLLLYCRDICKMLFFCRYYKICSIKSAFWSLQFLARKMLSFATTLQLTILLMSSFIFTIFSCLF